MLEEVFRSLRPDNGRVGFDGLRALFQCLGIEKSDDQLESIVKQIDKQGYGTVSLNEFIKNL